MRWEKLLENAIFDGFMAPDVGHNWIEPRALSAAELEGFAKKAVAKVLTDKAFSYPHASERARLPLSDAFGDVISLNFDHCWVGRASYSIGPVNVFEQNNGVNKFEHFRLTSHLEMEKANGQKPTRVWFPNGHVKNPSSIRMGLYDYGSQAHAIKQAFGWVKSCEPKVTDKEMLEDWGTYFKYVKAEFEKPALEQEPKLANWVAHFLYSPLYFAGVGLSEQETGLWWLLAQRARNFARLASIQKPETVVLVGTKDKRRDFWSMRPFGVEPQFCDDWDQGWDKLRDRCAQVHVD